MTRRFTLSSGRGPMECRRAVRAVAAEFIAAIKALGLDADCIPGFDPDGEGPVSATILVIDAERRLDAVLPGWLGTIQWVARSEKRARAARKNWFVSLCEEPPATGSAVTVRESDVVFSAITAGGPGGQHQNKTASAVRATHHASGVTVVVRSERSQHRNKAMALGASPPSSKRVKPEKKQRRKRPPGPGESRCNVVRRYASSHRAKERKAGTAESALRRGQPGGMRGSALPPLAFCHRTGVNRTPHSPLPGRVASMRERIRSSFFVLASCTA